MRFKDYLEEETAAGDIAGVDSRLGADPAHKPSIKHRHKGKRCKLHRLINCEDCLEDNWGDD